MEKVGNKKNFYIISSINLPIVLSILLDKDIPTESNLKELIDKSQVRLMEFPTKLSLESDDSFLS
jgi:hypothetical protein